MKGIEIITIFRKDKECFYDITIMPHKDSGRYSFVNLTKGHICKCEFNTYVDAWNDLIKNRDEGTLDIVSIKNVTTDLLPYVVLKK